MAKNSHEFVFAIAASMNSNFRSTFADASERIALLKEGIKDYGKIQNQVYLASEKGIISKKAYLNAQKQLGLYSANARQSITDNFQKAFVDSAAFYIGAKNFAMWFAGPVQEAMRFESAMADVKKVVDFDSPKQFKDMERDILRLTRVIPMTAEGLSKIVSAGGQSGIDKNELTLFAENAAKMGVAYDISADQAGDMMAKWRTAFKMSQADVVSLADKINYLGNTTAASAPLISDVVTRIGPLGEVGGVSSGEIAAMGASLVGSGIQSEVAATGIKNLILTMTAGEGATKSQSEAFADLGLNAEYVAEKMQKDAKGAIIEVLSALKDLDKVQQATVLAKLFGKESLSAIAPLLSNLEGLQENFAKVADKAKYAGSMEAEFAARSKTHENNIQLMNNKIAAAQIVIGQGLLPLMVPLVEVIGDAATVVGEFASEYPNVIKYTTMAAGAVLGLTGAWHMYNLISNTYIATSLAVKTAMNSTIVVTLKNMTLTKALTLATNAWSASMAYATGKVVFLKSMFLKLFAIMSAHPFIMIAAAGVAAAYYLWDNWDTVKDWFTTLWDNPEKAMKQFVNSIKTMLGALPNWVKEKWENVTNILNKPIFGEFTTPSSTIASNAKGGIYGKGAFVTSFAENSPEAAIPIDGSQRAKNLWAQTGEMLGVGSGSPVQVTFSPTITIQGNASREDVNRAMDLTLDKLEEMLIKLSHRQRRLSYG